MKKFIIYIKEVLFLLGGNAKKLPWLIVVFLSASILDLVGIGLIAPYVAVIVSPDNFTETALYPLMISLGMSTQLESIIITLGLVLITVFLAKTIAAILINRIIIVFCFEQSMQLRSSLMRAYQNLPYIRFLERNSSEYIHNIHLADKFAGGTLQSILRLVSDGLIALMILILLAYTNGAALALLVFLLGGMIFIYDRIFRPNIGIYGRLSNEYSTQVVQGVHEGIEGLKEIRILGREAYFHKTLEDGAKGFSDVNVKSTMISTAPRFLLEFIMVTFVVLLVLGSLIFEQNIGTLLPTLSMFGVASMRLAPAANQLISGITKIRFGRHSVKLLYSDLKQLEQFSTPINSSLNIVDSTFQELVLQNVDFSYPNSALPALSNISLKIQAGDAIGLTGTSGSGKTTLVDMLLGLLEPQKGNILYNGKSIDKHISDWRSQVAYLPQQVFLLDNTLRKNVALGVDDDDINDDKVEEALKQARLTELVKQLPHGIDTFLGERGVRLSGGQRQRVALARAFYHDRNVLVMDESTSALDSDTEHEIVEEIKQFKGKKTLIVIAHRLTTLQHCNRIYRLERGELVKQGSYEDVLGNMIK